MAKYIGDGWFDLMPESDEKIRYDFESDEFKTNLSGVDFDALYIIPVFKSERKAYADAQFAKRYLPKKITRNADEVLASLKVQIAAHVKGWQEAADNMEGTNVERIFRARAKEAADILKLVEALERGEQ
jgi:hypothetical protein